MNFDCGIYAITSPSGRRYIGQAQSFSRRWYVHRLELRAGSHHCQALQRAWNKYGEERMTFSKIAFVPLADLDYREQEQIDALSPRKLYNTALCVKAPMRGRKHTPKALKLMSRAQSGPNNPAWGKKQSKETLEKRSLANMGRVKSAEERAKISAGVRGEKNAGSRPVVCWETGQIFASMADAAVWLRANGWPRAAHQNIYVSCRTTRKAYGFRWVFANPKRVPAGFVQGDFFGCSDRDQASRIVDREYWKHREAA